MSATPEPAGADARPRPATPLGLTRTEQKFYALLSDGRPHGEAEMTKYLWDELGINLKVAIAMHMSRMRPKLAEIGQYISTVKVNDRCHYLLTRSLAG